MSQHVLRAYDPATEREVFVITIHGVPLGELREIVGVSAEDPMYDAYPLDAVRLRRLADRIGLAVPDVDARYFVEFHGT